MYKIVEVVERVRRELSLEVELRRVETVMRVCRDFCCFVVLCVLCELVETPSS